MADNISLAWCEPLVKSTGENSITNRVADERVAFGSNVFDLEMQAGHNTSSIRVFLHE